MAIFVQLLLHFYYTFLCILLIPITQYYMNNNKYVHIYNVHNYNYNVYMYNYNYNICVL